MLAGVLVMVAMSFMLFLWYLERGPAGADKAELGATYQRWEEANRPVGSNGIEFLRGRKSGLQLTTNTYVVEGIPYQGALSLTNLRNGPGMLVITTNSIFIRVKPDGTTHLFH